MADSREFASHIVDLMEPFGTVEAKRMFGGFGIFHQGLMIALVSDGNLYLKADAQSKSHFEDQGLEKLATIKRTGNIFYLTTRQPNFSSRTPMNACVGHRWRMLLHYALQRKRNQAKNPQLLFEVLTRYMPKQLNRVKFIASV